MESNFIKERIVVREQLIKKNLKSKKEGSRDPKPSTSTQNLIDNPKERVAAFEELVNDRLRQDLADLSRQVDTICQTIADYLKVKSAIKIFKKNPRDLRVQTNLGCNFYAQCRIEDASQIYLCVGQDYFLRMDSEEALKMIDFKEKQWTKQLDTLQERSSKIKAYIKIALEAMGRLYEVDNDKLEGAG